MPSRRLASFLPLALLPLFLGACRAAIPPWGASAEAARRNVDNAFAAFAYRFHNVQRDARFAAARPRMAKYALIPSRIFNDTSIWTGRDNDSTRSLHLNASFVNNRYTFVSRPAAAYPARVGDQRHIMLLTSLGQDTYAWTTIVDHGIGPVRAPQVANAIGTTLTAFEGRRDAELLADARTAFPRTAAHLGRILTLDSLRSTPQSDGATAFAMHLTLAPDGVRDVLPFFAAYLDKYLVPTVYRVQLTDRQGAQYLDLAQRDARIVVRLRARQGRLVALAGAPRPIPDSLRIHLDVSMKYKLFRVGFTDLVGDFTIERGEHERAWMMRFREEPDWHFPLAVDKLIKTPLRRPFEGTGTELRMGVRDDLGSQAMSVRQARTVVRESAIMRWLGGLGSSAFGDFEGRSELEENRFLADLFGALRKDIAMLSP